MSSSYRLLSNSRAARGVLAWLLAVFLGFIITGCQNVPQAGMADKVPVAVATTDDAGRPLLAGDSVDVSVAGEDDASRKYKIDSDGFIDLVLAGRVQMAGSTPREAAVRVAQAYRNGFFVDPRVTVTRIAAKPVYVMGDVRTPGSRMAGDARTVAAVAADAGAREGARYTIIRNGRAMRAAGGDSVAPGDVVYVEGGMP